MHISIRNEDTGEVDGILCVDRTAGTCVVLQADVEKLDDLVQVAFAMKAPEVFVFVPKAAVKELEIYGWTKSSELVLMSKRGANGHKST